jgi:non-specific protein-tyrosine kinase
MIEPQSPSDDLRHYFAIVWRWAWLIVLATVLASVAAFIASQFMAPIYQASSTLMVNEAPGSQAADYTAILTSQRLAQTYAQMLTKKPVLSEVISRLELNLSTADLKEMITIQPVRDTQLIDILVEDYFPNRAAAIANTIGVVFADQNKAMQEARYANTKESLKLQLDEIQVQINDTENAILAMVDGTQAERDRLEFTLLQFRQTYTSTLQSYEQVRLAEAETISNVIQVELADSPTTPIRPRTLMNTALAGVVGAMLAVGVIFLVEALDDTIRGTEAIQQALELPVLGVIRKFDKALRTNIQFTSVDFPISSILVTSPSPEDGKTTVAINLSIVLAQGGKKVALIDADLRRPRVHERMRVSNRWGLTSLFMNEDIHLESALRKDGSSGLSVITSGILPPNPAELLGSEKMQLIIEELKTQVDIIVIDSSPLTAVTDSAVLSKRVDGVILVANNGQTHLAAAQKAIEQLRHVDANILGVVLNSVGRLHSRYYYNAYYADYSQAYFTDQKRRVGDTSTAYRKVGMQSKGSRRVKS